MADCDLPAAQIRRQLPRCHFPALAQSTTSPLAAIRPRAVVNLASRSTTASTVGPGDIFAGRGRHDRAAAAERGPFCRTGCSAWLDRKARRFPRLQPRIVRPAYNGQNSKAYRNKLPQTLAVCGFPSIHAKRVSQWRRNKKCKLNWKSYVPRKEAGKATLQEEERLGKSTDQTIR